MPARTSIVVIDALPLFRRGVAAALQISDNIDIVGEGATANDAVALVTETAADLLLVDGQVLGRGLEIVEAIIAESPRTKIVVITAGSEKETLQQAFRIGVCGYLVKGVGTAELLAAVEAVASGELYVSQQLMRQILTGLTRRSSELIPGQSSSVAFTNREEQILSLLPNGMSNKQIACALVVSEKTVKYYLTIIMKKLNARNRVEVALFAFNRKSAFLLTFSSYLLA